ncbi:SsgA family sporulation/cell division regulator [Lentzea sp. NBRC 102530]|uniref:SsgA family sporulation/cell division regulator n=1 Tax=Lentzea sp. NBRC 102530 TaxID=3032201 RepID=UPI0024A22CF8|nr:SsgA family sporulation/cell division regulator [Lentzea sp. NBRC 102530]GLY54487.1 hypothetical protein Lesp01_81430 [Lentzea sp. NBRC 102530]
MDNTCTHRAEFTLLDEYGGARSIAADMTYRASDPFAVELTLTLQRLRPVKWLVARSLLTEGVLEPSGAGDIRLQPLSRGIVSIELLPPSGYALLHARAEDLLVFLAKTYAVVRPGSEQVDIDELIINLVNSQQ